MSLFLFAKQIVDMLYQYKILDYIMVGILFVMMIYQIILVRPNIRNFCTGTDGIILLAGGMVSFAFSKNISEYETYFKVISAFFMYYIGRIYYERIQECYGALVFSSYFIVYLNFLTRIWNFGGELFWVNNAGGDLYYYDTDMAYAMILSLIFIGMFGKNTILKVITIFLICPYMVFCSDAGIQKLLMLIIIVIIIIYIIELIILNYTLTNILLFSIIVGIVISISFIYMPLVNIEIQDYLDFFFQGKLVDYKNMYIRYEGWREIINQVNQQRISVKLLGNGLYSNIQGGLETESLYVKIYYTSGWIGLMIGFLLLISITCHIIRIKDRKTLYLMVMMVILLLGTGVTINSMERVQMSWFPMMFAGMVVSSVKEENE